jgi:hypothetical protein
MLTPGSSIVLPFQPNQPPTRKGAFEAGREDWIRTVFADESLWGSDKNVAAFLALHLNRETRTCWPSYSTVGKGLGVDRANVRRSVRRLIARGYLARKPRGKGQTNAYFPTGTGVVTVTPGVVTVTTAVLSQLPPRTSEVEPLKEPLEGVVTVTPGKEEKGGLSRDKEEQKTKPSDSPSLPSPSPNEGVPRAAPNGGGRAGEVFVRYDTPQWDMVERYGKAVGKVFMRYGRVEGHWILKADLKAIEAAANGGGQ